jgi:hypothetical protein
MSSDRIKGNVSFFCDLDGCEEGLETETKDFKEAASDAKEAGWQFRKREEVWCAAHEEMDYRGQSLAK